MLAKWLSKQMSKHIGLLCTGPTEGLNLWNPLHCLYCDVRVGKRFSFSFDMAERDSTSKIIKLEIAFNAKYHAM